MNCFGSLDLNKESSLSREFVTSVGFPGALDSKESACSEGDLGSVLGKIPLKKGMAVHFSILAWRIPWTEEPDGLKSMRSQRVRQD